MKTTTIAINGMHCVSCEQQITDVLEEIDGVSKVTVNHRNGSATVTHRETVTDAQLRRVIEAEGYQTS
jgi:copper chaperone CopZ